MKTVFTLQEIDSLQKLVKLKKITQSQFVARLNEMAHEAYVDDGKLPIPNVSNQKELLVKFANYCNSFNIENNNIYEEDVDDFLNQ